jgi:hypothetical protein
MKQQELAEQIAEDIEFIKSILPQHYIVQESKKKGSIHCRSEVGIRKSPYNIRVREKDNDKGLSSYKYQTITVTDAEDEEHWEYIFQAIKQHFGERFQEVYHNTCFCHVDFTIYLKTSINE